MRTLYLAGLACVMSSTCAAAAPTGRLELPAFNDLQQSARETVDITLGSLPLHIASLLAADEDDQDAKDLLKSVSAVYVRSYQFDTDFAYPIERVQAVRKQLAREGWSPLVQLKEKQQHNVDISIALDGKQVKGFAIVATDPRQFTIVNIVGSLDVKQLGKVQERLGLPKVASAELEHMD
ncbi:MAG TPA: DUF4252 domain-containing protein [Steroidobacteraceae bacterium]|nr:DUF4252 domain-containing protein [Steroidobacteraceae bacterium]